MDISKIGVTKEELKQSEEIKESFDFSKIKDNESVVFEFMNDEVKEIEIEAKHENKDKKIKVGDKIKVPTIEVKPLTLINGSESLDYNVTDSYTLWLNSKTLALGVGVIANENESVKGLKFMVTKTKAKYKQGTNVCYKVKLLEKETEETE